MKKLLLLILMLISGVILMTSTVAAQETSHSLTATPVVTGLNFPTQATQTPDGGWFVIERAGDLVRIHPDGTHETQVNLKANSYHERGALGLAIGREGDIWYAFVLYTVEYTPEVTADDGDPRTGQLVRFQLDNNFNVISDSRTVILGTEVGDTRNPSCNDFPVGSDCIAADGRTHAPDTLHVYQDGDHLVLLVSMGESADDQTVNVDALRAQYTHSLAGKILSIDFQGNGLPDNPFYNGDPDANISKIFAMGFRNPFTFTYWLERGNLTVGICDVGAQDFEEFDVAYGGENFGWPFREGPAANNGYMATYGAEATGTYSEPQFFVSHADQPGAIVCGHKLSQNYAPYTDQLLYGGFGWTTLHARNLMTNTDTLIGTTFMPATTISYVDGNDGYIYAVDMMGTISRLELVENEPIRTFTEPTEQYLIDVFDNASFAGVSVFNTTSATIDFEWGESHPFDLTFDDNYSIRAYKAFNAEFAAEYKFTTFVDDGVRIYLDNQLILDEWHGSSGTYYEVTVPVTAGLHTVRFEYFEGAVNATFKADFYPTGN